MCINFVDMLCFIIMECKMLIIILIFELLILSKLTMTHTCKVCVYILGQIVQFCTCIRHNVLFLFRHSVPIFHLNRHSVPFLCLGAIGVSRAWNLIRIVVVVIVVPTGYV